MQFFLESAPALTSLTVPAFDDSTDSTGTYVTGICGEKVITLASDTPGFIGLTLGLNPVLDDFNIDFFANSVSLLDVGTYTISYTVALIDYPHLAILTDSFTFELNGCQQTRLVENEVVSTIDVIAG